jgi:outer membrane protein OmpA-like peptidoglycan-associated protein
VYFQESPVWTKDPVVAGYIKTCQESQVGDAINPVYAAHLAAEGITSAAVQAYNSQRYWEALDLYQSALRTPAGEQLRVYNGLYLAHWKLGHRDDAARAFGRMVAYGLAQEHLAVKFLFKPGSTALWSAAQSRNPHLMWLQQIARHTTQQNMCLEIIGHTSRTGPEPLNERLSLRRAEYIQARLEAEAPPCAIGPSPVARARGKISSGLRLTMRGTHSIAESNSMLYAAEVESPCTDWLVYPVGGRARFSRTQKAGSECSGERLRPHTPYQ